MNSNEFEARLQADIRQAEAAIRAYLPGELGRQQVIAEAMEYSLLAGGKRLRPVFMLEWYRLCGGREKVILPLMAAIEMIHTYSLVHDDLPAMDDDEYRRGRKTTHVVYGEDIGILTGDALLNYAFETALQGFALTTKPQQLVRALQILSRKAGIHGMLGGQVIDVKETGRAVSAAVLETIYRLKTAALLEAAMQCGAVLAGAAPAEVEQVGQIARDVGLAFQIQDDILDVTSTTAELGKPVHSDEKNQKTTYVTLYGLAAARQQVAERSAAALSGLAAFPGDSAFLQELISALIQRKK